MPDITPRFTRHDPRLRTDQVRDAVSRRVAERLAATRRWDDEGFMVTRETNSQGEIVAITLHDVLGGGNMTNLRVDGTWGGPWDSPNPQSADEAEARLRVLFRHYRRIHAYLALEEQGELEDSDA